jgi:hypothetical protein
VRQVTIIMGLSVFAWVSSPLHVVAQAGSSWQLAGAELLPANAGAVMMIRPEPLVGDPEGLAMLEAVSMGALSPETVRSLVESLGLDPTRPLWLALHGADTLGVTAGAEPALALLLDGATAAEALQTYREAPVAAGEALFARLVEASPSGTGYIGLRAVLPVTAPPTRLLAELDRDAHGPAPDVALEGSLRVLAWPGGEGVTVVRQVGDYAVLDILITQSAWLGAPELVPLLGALTGSSGRPAAAAFAPEATLAFSVDGATVAAWGVTSGFYPLVGHVLTSSLAAEDVGYVLSSAGAAILGFLVGFFGEPQRSVSWVLELGDDDSALRLIPDPSTPTGTGASTVPIPVLALPERLAAVVQLPGHVPPGSLLAQMTPGPVLGPLESWNVLLESGFFGQLAFPILRHRMILGAPALLDLQVPLVAGSGAVQSVVVGLDPSGGERLMGLVGPSGSTLASVASWVSCLAEGVAPPRCPPAEVSESGQVPSSELAGWYYRSQDLGAERAVLWLATSEELAGAVAREASLTGESALAAARMPADASARPGPRAERVVLTDQGGELVWRGSALGLINLVWAGTTVRGGSGDPAAPGESACDQAAALMRGCLEQACAHPESHPTLCAGYDPAEASLYDAFDCTPEVAQAAAAMLELSCEDLFPPEVVAPSQPH